MRAYLAVIPGECFYQDRATGHRFGSSPLLVNTGSTPAHDVGFRAAVAVLSIPLPPDFEFPLPDIYRGAAVLGPHQQFTLTELVMSDFVDDSQVEPLMKNHGRGVYVWGEVRYRDAFGEDRRTSFCHLLTWRWPLQADQAGLRRPVSGIIYPERHNSST